MAASQQSILINTSDLNLIEKEPLDYGGFGEVFLCNHKTYGHVVLKTVYTGPRRSERHEQPLMEEGTLMRTLNHERIVKLLGVISENGVYSLVMELMPKGNLMSLLQEVSTPMSIKGRIIVQILEGMVYLTDHKIIHKDLKPENILVDKDFHIKIADLGLATHQSWSRLTKDETRWKSRKEGRSNIRPAGTLIYLAPEHLESIHTRFTEKSDVYSFAIVVWVILTNLEPYENALSEDHVCQCVRKGDRPDESAIPPETPQEMKRLMKKCWHPEPDQRPTFAESFKSFQPFYKERLEKNVEKDSLELMARYEGPDHYLSTIRSVSLDRTQADFQVPLRSADSVPIEASIEDLSVSDDVRDWPLQTDAGPFADSSLQSKLDQELGYHQRGVYSPEENHAPESHQRPAPYALPPWNAPEEGAVPRHSSSVQSWSKTGAELARPATAGHLLPLDSYSMQSSSISKASSDSFHGARIPPVSMNSFPPLNRLLSNLGNSTPESEAPDCAAWKFPKKSGKMQSADPGSLVIQNANAVQIGNNNRMHLRSQDLWSGSFQSSMQSCKNLYNELLLLYEDRPVREEHLDLLRENIGAKWKSCARQLGLTETEVETIDHDYSRDGLKEKVYQMLEKWKMKEGLVGCTMGRLSRSLYGSIKVDLLCQLLQLSQSPTS